MNPFAGILCVCVSGVEICCLPEWSVIDTQLDKRKALSGWNADWPLIVRSRCITLCNRWTQECSCAHARCHLSVRYVIVDADMWTHLVKGSAVWPSLERVCELRVCWNATLIVFIVAHALFFPRCVPTAASAVHTSLNLLVGCHRKYSHLIHSYYWRLVLSAALTHRLAHCD